MEARSGRSDEAAKLFVRASKKGSRPDGATWQARALHSKAEGNFAEARRCLEEGVAADAKHIPLYHAWGQLELEEHNISAARDIYQRGVWASRNERDTISLWSAWAMLEERCGDYEQVSEVWSSIRPRDACCLLPAACRLSPVACRLLPAARMLAKPVC